MSCLHIFYKNDEYEYEYQMDSFSYSYSLSMLTLSTVRPEAFFRLALQRPANKPLEPKEDKARKVKVKVDNESLDHVSNIDVKVSKTLHASNDCIAGRLSVAEYHI